MLFCGKKNSLVETALKYLPDEVFIETNEKIGFTVLKSDACCLSHKIQNYNEIIVLSPWIFSFIPSGSCETDKEWKYFIFCILHEVAHAFLKHHDPDELSGNERDKQEEEADRHALNWFNDYVSENCKKGYKGIVIEEIRNTQKEYQEKLKLILNLD